MKKILVIVALGLILSGCAAEETYETIADDMILSVMAQPREIRVVLPEESVLPAMENDGSTLYMCKDYDVTVQTMENGDLNATVKAVSGYSAEELTLIQTASGELSRYEFVWTAAGDEGHRVGRATILDDGSYHYVLTATVSADLIEEYQEIWNGIFESFSLI